mmetsp:Transcript_7527/g.46272  ORF Transcript_7527/g.46272 Transcript_7527/m.46272 type:complete len:247 (+) Transcript_7527:454-1194(+)
MDRHACLGHHEHPVSRGFQRFQTDEGLFSFQQLSEHRVLLVQVRSRTQQDGKRSGGGVRILMASHAERASFVLELRKLSLDGAGSQFFQCIRRRSLPAAFGICDLRHKSAVHTKEVVRVVSTEATHTKHVIYSQRCYFGIERHHQIAVSRVEHHSFSTPCWTNVSFHRVLGRGPSPHHPYYEQSTSEAHQPFERACQGGGSSNPGHGFSYPNVLSTCMSQTSSARHTRTALEATSRARIIHVEAQQ